MVKIRGKRGIYIYDHIDKELESPNLALIRVSFPFHASYWDPIVRRMVVYCPVRTLQKTNAGMRMKIFKSADFRVVLAKDGPSTLQNADFGTLRSMV